MLVLIWVVLASFFVGVPGFYYLFLKRAASKNWNLDKRETYRPMVTIMVPMYNEEKTIRLKLINLAKLQYPEEKLQILLINDGSTDGTLKEIDHLAKTSRFSVEVVDLHSQNGKIKALNKALGYAKGEIVVVSDSDAFLSPGILDIAIPFFADPAIGAIISREELLNADATWVSETENIYYHLAYRTIKLGESKVHSTIMFHGGFAAYRKSLLEQFNVETDDTGTALDLVQNGHRTIMIPEAVSYGVEFVTWKDKFNIKVRRARHNVKTWIRCLQLLLRGELRLPKKIALPEIFLYLLSPIIFIMLLATTTLLAVYYPLFILLLFLAALPLLFVKLTRLLFVETVQNNFFLLIGIVSLFLRREIISWKTMQDPRSIIREDMLESRNLI